MFYPNSAFLITKAPFLHTVMYSLLKISICITTRVKIELWPFRGQESSSILQMAAVYGIQQTAKHAPAFFIPKCDEVSVYDALWL